METTPSSIVSEPQSLARPGAAWLRAVGRAAAAAWRWLPEVRPMMAEDLSALPHDGRTLIVQGRVIVIPKR